MALGSAASFDAPASSTTAGNRVKLFALLTSASLLCACNHTAATQPTPRLSTSARCSRGVKTVGHRRADREASLHQSIEGSIMKSYCLRASRWPRLQIEIVHRRHCPLQAIRARMKAITCTEAAPTASKNATAHKSLAMMSRSVCALGLSH